MIEPISGEDIIVKIVEQMCASLEPLLYTTRAPSLYHVYLQRQDYERLKGIIPAIIDEAKMALDQKLSLLNEQARKTSRLSWLSLTRKPSSKTYVKPEEGWNISFRIDDDLDDSANCRIEVLMVAPVKPVFGSGTKTILVSSSSSESKHSTPTQRTPGHAGPVDRVLAIFTYEDQSGKQKYLMKKSQIAMGRGGVDYWVDLRFETKSDVSHEHAHVRYDEAVKKFYIKDLSTFGTTINGTAIPSSLETVHGTKRDKNVWVSLPHRAQIGLADVLFIEFEGSED
jgi:FHA domain